MVNRGGRVRLTSHVSRPRTSESTREGTNDTTWCEPTSNPLHLVLTSVSKTRKRGLDVLTETLPREEIFWQVSFPRSTSEFWGALDVTARVAYRARMRGALRIGAPGEEPRRRRRRRAEVPRGAEAKPIDSARLTHSAGRTHGSRLDHDFAYGRRENIGRRGKFPPEVSKSPSPVSYPSITAGNRGKTLPDETE